MGLWVADGEKGLMLLDQNGWHRVGPPGEALCQTGGRLWCAGTERCYCYAERTGDCLCDTALPTGVCALAALRNRVYALSSDADSITAFTADTGEIIGCTPAGVYPRDICAYPGGRLLLAPGGASGATLLFHPDLPKLNPSRLPRTACGACLPPRRPAPLSAVERGETLAARLYAVSFRGVVEDFFSLPLVPNCLCPLPDGGCVMGCCGEIIRFHTNKKAALRQPFSCPLRLRAARDCILLCEAGDGVFLLPSRRRVYTGPNALDALLV